MTNITLSIENTIYELMKKYSEIRWSEFVRKAIKNRVEELQKLEKNPKNESIMTMFASEEVLNKDWNNKADARWDNV